MKKKSLIFIPLVIANLGFFLLNLFLWQNLSTENQNQLFSPFVSQEKVEKLHLEKYSIPRLSEYNFQANQPLKLDKIISKSEDFTSYQFSFITLNKKMTGQINIPSNRAQTETGMPAIVMLRGWAPLETYTSGTGTKNASAYFSKNGFITIAPDFFGYGESDADFTDNWEARFIKPINVVELLKTIDNFPQLSFDQLSDEDKKNVPISLSAVLIDKNKIGMWGHSNGGQIALTTQQILSQIEDRIIPTTLWAPVTAPFPYSILFFSDESEDEGKQTRKWISLFEEKYDVFDFSLTQHLDKLTGPIQIHHGSADDSALKAWSDEFIEKVEKENQRRSKFKNNLNQPAHNEKIATDSSMRKSELDDGKSNQISNNKNLLDPIKITYFTYPGANHNLQPGWDVVVSRDLVFFKQNL